MALTVQELIQEHYGTDNIFTLRNPEGIVTASTTAAQIVKNNPNRVAMIVVNLSDVPIYLNNSSTVSSTNGFRISSNGGSFFIEWRLDGAQPSREWWVVSSSGSGKSIFTDAYLTQ